MVNILHWTHSIRAETKQRKEILHGTAGIGLKKLDGHKIKTIYFPICFILFERICFPHTHPILANFRAEFLQDEVQAVRSFLKHKLLKLIPYMAKAGDVNWGNSLPELTDEPPVRKWTTNEYAWYVKLKKNYYQEDVSLKEQSPSVPLAASLCKGSSLHQSSTFATLWPQCVLGPQNTLILSFSYKGS